MSKKFCTSCGSKMIEEWTGTYDENSGKKKMGLRCSNVKECFRNRKHATESKGLMTYLFGYHPEIY